MSQFAGVAIIVLLICLFTFFGWSLKQQRHLLHKLYQGMVFFYSLWLLPLLGMRMVGPGNQTALYLLDAVTQVAGITSVYYLLIALTIVKGYERAPRYWAMLFVVPSLVLLAAFTNPLHHLMYVNFSIFKSEVVFGPMVYISGIHSYLCLIYSIGLMLSFGIRSHSGIYRQQSFLVGIGGVFPLCVSMVATMTEYDISIDATPLSFIPLVGLNGVAIYRLHLFDLKPMAIQHVLDWIADCYIILSDKKLVVSFNQPFAQVFASKFGIKEKQYLQDCVQREGDYNNAAIYNLLMAVEECDRAGYTISYEESVLANRGAGVRKYYYIAEVTPLKAGQRNTGYIGIFKDVTQLKQSMQQLQDNQKRMMEQERFAFLGQMMGGLAHNLKTPIMSVAGCVSATEGLVAECESSLSDPQVTREDYLEIYGEMRDWQQKITDACGYMSDIITAVKGQAASVGAFESGNFTLEELIKRASLLIRHEMHSNKCSLVAERDECWAITLSGDVNNLTQVLVNLLSNAVDAQKQVGGGNIILKVEKSETHVKIYVRDSGPGIAADTLPKLFQTMTTSKGIKGSGLGLYISNVVVQGKFGGYMWAENNAEGGATIGMAIPLSHMEQRDSQEPVPLPPEENIPREPVLYQAEREAGQQALSTQAEQWAKQEHEPSHAEQKEGWEPIFAQSDKEVGDETK